MMYTKILVMVLENSSSLEIMMKDVKKDQYLLEKNKKMIRLMKNKKSGKIVTKFEAITPKSYSYCVKFTRENGVKNQ